MHNHLKQPSRAIRLFSAAAALAAATTIAACGSSAPAGSTAASRTSSSDSIGSSSNSTGSTLAFSSCMRANGVPNFPDLSNHGMLIQGNAQTVSVNGVSLNAPAFRTARAQCQKYLPAERANATQTARQSERGLEFAKCMRSHGVPKFPDPKVISTQGGNQQVYLPGVNPQSPAFEAAAKSCGFGPKGP
jgi:hypothetical protein